MHQGRKALCPEGNLCALNPEVDHEFCICSDTGCKCHEQARYLPKKQPVLVSKTQPEVVLDSWGNPQALNVLSLK